MSEKLKANLLIDRGKIALVQVFEHYHVPRATVFKGFYLRLPTRQQWYHIQENGGRLTKVVTKSVLENFYQEHKQDFRAMREERFILKAAGDDLASALSNYLQDKIVSKEEAYIVEALQQYRKLRLAMKEK